MKSLLTVLILFFQFGFTFAQCQEPGQATRVFQDGAINVTHKVSGTFINGGADPGMTIQNDAYGSEPLSILNSASIWMAGVDHGNNLKAVLSDGKKTDWYPGPLTPEGLTDNETCKNFDQIFEITGEELKAFIADYEDNLKIDDEHPAIFGWPAVGNEFFEDIHGFKFPDENNIGAPFWDFGDNGVLDGRFNPEKGDIPRTKSNSFDIGKMQYWIMNDHGAYPTSGEYDRNRMQVEIMAWTLDKCFSGNGRIYYWMKFRNRATEDILDMKIGVKFDAQIGNASCDQAGFFEDHQLSYFHHNTSQDSLLSCDCLSENDSSCESAPLVGIHHIRGPIDQNFNEVAINSFVSFEQFDSTSSPTSAPNEIAEYLNIMSGNWSNGSSIYALGNGIDPDTAATTNLAFSSISDDYNGWKMCKEKVNYSDLAVYTGYVGEDLNLWPGATNELIFSVMVSNPKPKEECPRMNELILMADQNYCLFGSCWFPDPFGIDCIVPPPPVEPIPFSINIFPNPTATFLDISVEGGPLLKALSIFNSIGQLVYEVEAIYESTFRIEDLDLVGLHFLVLSTEHGVTEIHNLVYL